MTLTSATALPPCPRMDSTLIGLSESNISQSVSARRNKAAGVVGGNENVRCNPPLSRLTLTSSAPAAALVSTGAAAIDSACGALGDISALAGACAAGAVSTTAAGGSPATWAI